GPDDLLAQGVGDFLEKKDFVVFGPKKAAAKLEWSKAFAKEMMQTCGVPTAESVELTAADLDTFESKLETLLPYPVVLKYDGLALGKGVVIAQNTDEARSFLKEVFEEKKFERVGFESDTKAAAPVVLAEEFLTGFEVSLFAICDGKDYALLQPACDYKKLKTGNRGPNTGGMGAYSPVPWLPDARCREIADKIFKPILDEMRARKVTFRGLLYAGLMVRGQDFWVLEFNVRFGDPETQALLPRLSSDLALVLYGAALGELEKALDLAPLRWKSEACVNIVAASRGYPEKPETGFEVHFDGFRPSEQQRLFFAGVRNLDGKIQTSGGRVFGISQLGPTIETALDAALVAMSQVGFEGMYFRSDIGRIGDDA
ncbi:MAG TPA: phosphoribosylamine--glycine ligase, partial [Oligoflexia bacterium]|nr:phosphoribosylamine--glycine ligase [Oligoflexia bacterium]